MASPRAIGVVRFGGFEFDPSSRELRKGRSRLRVPDQSLAILAMLLERPGEVVTREAIQARLWPHGTVVEFEHSVNSAIKRLRQALLDTASTPRFVETLPRKGYRFIGTLEPQEGEPAGLTPGTIISHYRILAEAGRGAMGVVYKAEDAKLGRMVALKFLPDELAAHPPALERLRREARMIGALNHPGICTVHELGEASGRVFLVMEFLEGESLRERIARKPPSEGELLDVAVQVAKALEVAHEQGMVHRDIKPDNLFLTKQGVVKLMDFGLAKLVEEESGGAPQSSVTGTSGYMSPEQVRGEALDARSDIYSLGKVLEELAGSSRPKKLLPILSRALADDPVKRWQSAGELRGALEAVRRKKFPRVALVMSLAVAVVAVAGLVVWLRVPNRGEDLAPVPLVSLPGSALWPKFSSDGNRVAFGYRLPPELSHSGPDDKMGIYVKQIGGGPPVRLTGARDRFPAWSPDDRDIAFLRSDGKVITVMLISAIGGGTPRELAKVDAPFFAGMSWTPDGRWLILSARESEDEPYGIWRVSTETGERRRLLPPPEVGPRIVGFVNGDTESSLSPDGRVLVFGRSLGVANTKLYAVRLTPDLRPEGPPQKLADQKYLQLLGIAWVGEREIVSSYEAPGGLFRMPVSGGASPRRLSWAVGGTSPTVARSQHRLVYSQGRSNLNLWRLDLRTGEYRMIIGSSYHQGRPQYSPDGSRIAFESDRSGEYGLWVCEADGENCQQLTSLRGSAGGTPRWSPDGRWLAFDSRGEGNAQIYAIPANGGPPRRVTSGAAENMIPSWSRDGHWIYFSSDRSGQYRVWKTPAGGGEAVQVTRTGGGGAAFESADGKYLYYGSERGGTNAIFRVLVGGGEEKQVAPGLANWAGFGVTGKGVYFLSDAKTLQLLDEKTGLIRTVARLEGHTADLGITVSVDDAYLVFAQLDSIRADLMLVEGFH
jgi:Tol biopolymer transport system component/DNA-binding winged helix-turn-helix (wHTH) protein